MANVSRRAVLAAITGSVGSALAGCLGGGGEEAPTGASSDETTRTPTDSRTLDCSPDFDAATGHIRPEGPPERVPAELVCEPDPDFRRLDLRSDEAVRWGDAPRGLALRTDGVEYALGETFRVTLTNVSDCPVETRVKAEYRLQQRTDAGWQTVFGAPDGGTPGPTRDIAIRHDPGEGFEWTLPLTGTGILQAFPYDIYETCPELSPGRYRFVFVGTVAPLAVAFDVTR